MRWAPLIVTIGILASIPVLAQRGGGGHGGGGMRGGGGAVRGGSSGGARFGGGVSGFRGGIARQPVFRGGFGFRPFSRFGYYNPYYYSGLYGGYGFYDPFFYDYGSDYSSSYGYPSDYGYSNNTAPYNGPQVVILQNPSGDYPPPPPPPPQPVVREYGPPAPQATNYETPLYLVAFQDGTIRAVLAYWVDGATLHYVSMDHEQKQAPLASIDRLLSERLNRERNVTFRLPR
jgi:hypothetical protein